MDYMPWLALITVIVLVVQWVLLARARMFKAKKDHMDQVTKQAPEGARKGPAPGRTRQPARIQPKRPRGGMPIVVEEGSPEFEIEYGNGTAKGGDRR